MPSSRKTFQVMFAGKLRAPAHEGADRRRRGVKNRHAVFLHDAPQTVLVRPIRRALVHYLGDAVGHRSVNDVRMAGDPADIRSAPEDVVFFHVEDPFVDESHTGQIAAGGVNDPLRFAGGAARVQDVEHVFAVHPLRLAPQRRIGHQHHPTTDRGLPSSARRTLSRHASLRRHARSKAYR